MLSRLSPDFDFCCRSGTLFLSLSHQAATNPELEAERRIRGNVRKLESRKRKIKSKLYVLLT